jgi:hypothetical protein
VTDAAPFPDLADGETRWRRLTLAKEICAVMDGANWLQSCMDVHHADAVRLVDFSHAAELLTKRLEALRASRLVLPPRSLERGVDEPRLRSARKCASAHFCSTDLTIKVSRGKPAWAKTLTKNGFAMPEPFPGTHQFGRELMEVGSTKVREFAPLEHIPHAFLG